MYVDICKVDDMIANDEKELSELKDYDEIKARLYVKYNNLEADAKRSGNEEQEEFYQLARQMVADMIASKAVIMQGYVYDVEKRKFERFDDPAAN